MISDSATLIVDGVLLKAKSLSGSSNGYIKGEKSQQLMNSAYALKYLFQTLLVQDMESIDNELCLEEISISLSTCIELINEDEALLSKFDIEVFSDALAQASSQSTCLVKNQPSDFVQDKRWLALKKQFDNHHEVTQVELDHYWEKIIDYSLDPRPKARRALFGIDNKDFCPLTLYTNILLRMDPTPINNLRVYWCLLTLDSGLTYRSLKELDDSMSAFKDEGAVIEYFMLRNMLHEDAFNNKAASFSYVAVAWNAIDRTSITVKMCLSDKAENDREVADFRGHITGENEVELRAKDLAAVMNITILSGVEGDYDIDFTSRKAYRVMHSLLPPTYNPPGSRLQIRPIGDLFRVPFEALPFSNDSETLGKRYAVSYVVEPVLCFVKLYSPEHHNSSRVLCVGDCDYDYEIPNKGKSLRVPRQYSFFEYLEGAHSEVDFLMSTYKVDALIGSGSSKRNTIESLANSPTIIHFSTHAFSIERQRHTSEEVHSRALTFSEPKFENCTYSAIALLGANGHIDDRGRFWANEDGLIQAEDILALDLTRTKLVFLSTCNSGIGLIDATREIDSLRSSFLAAGAKCVISSLWPIDDYEGAMFVCCFYEFLSQGISVSESLRQSRTHCTNLSDATRYAFVAIGTDQTFEDYKWK